MNLSPKIERTQSADSLNERVLSRIAQSKSTYWFGFFCDPITISFLLCWDAFALRANPLAIAACFLAGLCSWTLVEYCFHRWIYHRGETLAHAGHQLHHDEPEALIGMPWFLTTGFIYGMWLFWGYWLMVPAASSYISGLLCGFVFYYSFHHIHHHFRPQNSWYRKLRAHHKIHHQIPDTNFGVTNRFWDQVFRTTYRKSEPAMNKSSINIRRKPHKPSPRRCSEATTEVKAGRVSISQT